MTPCQSSPERFARAQGGAARVGIYIWRQPTSVAKVALGAGILVFTAVLALLIIPAMVVALFIFIAAAALLTLRALFSRPGTFLSHRDGRQNVRVIIHD